jgi:hypothetical protein
VLQEEANRLYITTVPQAVRWMAAVCLEYVSHAFPPLERELNRAREELTRMAAQVSTATRIMNVEIEASKGFRAETAKLQVGAPSL